MRLAAPASMVTVENIPLDDKAAYDIFKTGEAGKWFNVDGKQYAFPFTWGIQGINYQSDAIDAPGSYRDLLKPEFKDKFGIDLAFDRDVERVVVAVPVRVVAFPEQPRVLSFGELRIVDTVGGVEPNPAGDCYARHV